MDDGNNMIPTQCPTVCRCKFQYSVQQFVATTVSPAHSPEGRERLIGTDSLQEADQPPALSVLKLKC
eukprot:1160440-Pelagomonas_calceolata.AAC.5